MHNGAHHRIWGLPAKDTFGLFFPALAAPDGQNQHPATPLDGGLVGPMGRTMSPGILWSNTFAFLRGMLDLPQIGKAHEFS